MYLHYGGDGFRENIFINIHYQLSEDFFYFYFINIFVTSFTNQRLPKSFFCRRVVDFSQWNRKQRIGFFATVTMFFFPGDINWIHFSSLYLLIKAFTNNRIRIETHRSIWLMFIFYFIFVE